MINGLGIDFGTTNSVAALCDGRTGRTRGLTDPLSNLPHPSVVWFQGDRVIVGREAKHHLAGFAEAPGNVFIQSVKRSLGKGRSDNIFGEEKAADEVAAEIFRFLRTRAREDHGVEIEDAVVTVPVHFDGRARRDLRKAANEAGIHIKTFVHEPFAAIVGYLNSAEQRIESFDTSRILVFDWGGGTLDITVAVIRGGQIIEMGTGALDDIAGDYFDARIESFATARFVERSGLQPELVVPRSGTKARLRAECERVKILLSSELRAQTQLAQFFYREDRSYDMNEAIDRPAFEGLIRDDVEAAFREVDRVLNEAGLTYHEVTLVLMIGGTSRIPMVRREMERRFGIRMVEVRNPDIIIAEGAAVVASQDLRPFLARPVQVRLADDAFYTVFDAGTVILPEITEKTLTLFCTDNRDGVANLIIVETLRPGDSSSTRTKEILGIQVSQDLPKPYNHERVYASFSIDQDLVLQVRAHAATQPTVSALEIHDLAFGLRVA